MVTEEALPPRRPFLSPPAVTMWGPSPTDVLLWPLSSTEGRINTTAEVSIESPARTSIKLTHSTITLTETKGGPPPRSACVKCTPPPLCLDTGGAWTRPCAGWTWSTPDGCSPAQGACSAQEPHSVRAQSTCVTLWGHRVGGGARGSRGASKAYLEMKGQPWGGQHSQPPPPPARQACLLSQCLWDCRPRPESRRAGTAATTAGSLCAQWGSLSPSAAVGPGGTNCR